MTAFKMNETPRRFTGAGGSYAVSEAGLICWR